MLKYYFYLLFIYWIFSCISDEAKEEIEQGSSPGEKVCLLKIIQIKMNVLKNLQCW